MMQHPTWLAWDALAPMDGEDNVTWLRRVETMITFAAEQNMELSDEEIAWKRGMYERNSPVDFLDKWANAERISGESF